jgi:hypothetical protein
LTTDSQFVPHETVEYMVRNKFAMLHLLDVRWRQPSWTSTADVHGEMLDDLLGDYPLVQAT